MFGRSKRPPAADLTHCTHDTAECQRYQWWIKQHGKTVRVTRGAFAGYIGRLCGLGFTHGTVVHRAEYGLPSSTRELTVAYTDLEVVDDGPGEPPSCCECCCGYCDRCGHGLTGGECSNECHNNIGDRLEGIRQGLADLARDPKTARRHAAWITKIVLYATAYGRSREHTAEQVEEYLMQHFLLDSECPPEMCRRPYHCKHCGDCC